MSSEADSADRVAVLVVHGVAAKVPNHEFVNLEAVTNLLTFQDEDQLNACYRLNQSSTVQLHVGDLPKAPDDWAPDAGTRYTHMLMNRFQAQPYPYTTRRNELIRTKKNQTSAPPMGVHVHEFFWADLSRPASLRGFHSISAFLRLICSVCILGPKNLPRKEVTQRAGPLRGFYSILYGIQYAIAWMTLIYIPIAATAFLAGIVSLYLLTLPKSTIDAVVPVLAGLSVMIGTTVWYCAVGAKKELATKWQHVFNTWLRRGLYCTASSVLVAVGWYVVGDQFNLREWLAVSYVVVSFLIMGWLVFALRATDTIRGPGGFFSPSFYSRSSGSSGR